LGRAANALLDRHESMRSTFVVDEDLGAVALVRTGLDVGVAVHDLTTVGESARVAERDRILAADRATGFDMSAGPLIRIAALRLAPD
ncbi:hypothetical protein, partial [Leifsonia sp. SIMBA_070]|uniref:hypothetical protein n=1 Tax=Leifsonia sp. SIMBA_070 TaxID=3085810 RepID=UPI003978DFFE